MDRSRKFVGASVLSFATMIVVVTSGCLGPLLATGIYVAQGGNVVPAEYNGLKDKRVVVFCRTPALHEFRHAGAARNIARRVGRLIEMNIKSAEVVDQKEVDNWIDQTDGSNFKDLGRAVEADIVVQIELDSFSLTKGHTLYQGVCDATVSVYDMDNSGRLAWEKSMGELLYPRNSGIPSQDKSIQQFQREFEETVAEQIAVRFYSHDPHKLFAMDALANR